MVGHHLQNFNGVSRSTLVVIRNRVLTLFRNGCWDFLCAYCGCLKLDPLEQRFGSPGAKYCSPRVLIWPLSPSLVSHSILLVTLPSFIMDFLLILKWWYLLTLACCWWDLNFGYFFFFFLMQSEGRRDLPSLVPSIGKESIDLINHIFVYLSSSPEIIIIRVVLFSGNL